MAGDGEGIGRRRIWIRGRVQNVNFRWAAREHAQKLRLVGDARNLSDGSVEIVVQGPADALRTFEAWCYSGPDGAAVSSVDVSDEPVDPTTRVFTIE